METLFLTNKEKLDFFCVGNYKPDYAKYIGKDIMLNASDIYTLAFIIIKLAGVDQRCFGGLFEERDNYGKINFTNNVYNLANILIKKYFPNTRLSDYICYMYKDFQFNESIDNYLGINLLDSNHLYGTKFKNRILEAIDSKKMLMLLQNEDLEYPYDKKIIKEIETPFEKLIDNSIDMLEKIDFQINKLFNKRGISYSKLVKKHPEELISLDEMQNIGIDKSYWRDVSEKYKS